MANPNQPMGFIPRRHLSGGLVRHQDTFKLQSGYATALFRGDAVILTANYVTKALDNSAAILGIFDGVRYRDNTGKTQFSPIWVASTVTLGSEDVEVFVYTDRHISYRVQCDAGTAYVDATHRGTAVDLQATVAGSAITGQSGMEIDLADTGTGQFRVIGLIDEPNNAAGLNAKVEVVVNTPLIA